jgi:UDP-N-acetylmuramyl pentapeptide phosphotransferase/UDP-N-acetylglucosamine-1-phosphate transferase
MIVLSTFIVLLVTSFSAYIYKYLWLKVFNKKNVPTGFGIIFIYILLFYSYFIIGVNYFTIIFFIIALFSSIYWIDDIFYLSSIFRFILQFFTGLLLALVTLYLNDINFGGYNFLIIIFFGISNIFFSNIINFYDGLDLNVTTLILIFCFVLVQFMNLQAEYHLIGLIISSFMIGFALFNFMPNNIFFGDAGCFAFASFINLILIQSLINLDIQSVIFLFIPLALPIVDVGYVILLRLKLKESLLTRNYHHLYHIIELKYRNKLYLVPQVINLLLLLSLTHFINFYSVYNITVFILLSVVLTLLNYFLIRFNIKSKR